LTKAAPARQSPGSFAVENFRDDSRRLSYSQRDSSDWLAMRFLICCFLIALFGSSSARARDPAFEGKLASFVSAHSSAFPESLRARRAEVPIDLTIDRGGKLLDAAIPKNAVSAAEEAAILAALRRIQPFPPVPESLPMPYKLSAEFVFVSSVSNDEAVKRKIGGVCRGC
jgi:outer membrane biosynthesis protein TonB